jgi:hypothetical protein
MPKIVEMTQMTNSDPRMHRTFEHRTRFLFDLVFVLLISLVYFVHPQCYCYTVTNLDLSYNNLNGTIPSELGTLSNLGEFFSSSFRLIMIIVFDLFILLLPVSALLTFVLS